MMYAVCGWALVGFEIAPEMGASPGLLSMWIGVALGLLFFTLPAET